MSICFNFFLNVVYLIVLAKILYSIGSSSGSNDNFKIFHNHLLQKLKKVSRFLKKNFLIILCLLNSLSIPFLNLSVCNMPTLHCTQSCSWSIYFLVIYGFVERNYFSSFSLFINKNRNLQAYSIKRLLYS